MSKFFTAPWGLLLALACPLLGSEDVTITAPPAEASLTREEFSGLPEILRAERFNALVRKSPFTLASASQENADFAKDLTLAGYVRIDRQDYVMIANRSRPERILVGTSPSPSAQGMVLVKVEGDASGDPAKMQAKIRKGSEEAVLKYESVSAAPAAVPGAVPVQPGAVAPPPIPGQPQAVPGQPAQKNPPVIRRRVIPIPPPTR
jgi:hypothetical protein